MTSSTTNLRDQIQSALTYVDVHYKGNITTVTTTSNVSTDNKYRPLLDAIRNDLYHYDEEKGERIIYTINQHLAMNSKDDPELALVLKRVLEIVQRFQQTHEVIISPVRVSGNASVKEIGGTPRRLFDAVAPILNGSSDENR